MLVIVFVIVAFKSGGGSRKATGSRANFFEGSSTTELEMNPAFSSSDVGGGSGAGMVAMVAVVGVVAMAVGMVAAAAGTGGSADVRVGIATVLQASPTFQVAVNRLPSTAVAQTNTGGALNVVQQVNQPVPPPVGAGNNTAVGVTVMQQAAATCPTKVVLRPDATATHSVPVQETQFYTVRVVGAGTVGGRVAISVGGVVVGDLVVTAAASGAVDASYDVGGLALAAGTTTLSLHAKEGTHFEYCQVGGP